MGYKWDKWYYFKREVPKYVNSDKAESSPLDLLVPFALLALLAAIGVVGWQFYTYLKVGTWPPLSVVTALQWCKVEWAHSPSDWLGVHNLLNSFPLTLAIPIIGVVPLYSYVSWAEKAKKRDT